MLRPNGLYHATKPGGKMARVAKDLICLASFEGCSVYLGVGWRKKYKSPTDFGFALKPPQVSGGPPKMCPNACEFKFCPDFNLNLS